MRCGCWDIRRENRKLVLVDMSIFQTFNYKAKLMSQQNKKKKKQTKQKKKKNKENTETNSGLKGFEIAKILADCQIPDTDPTITKWKRLYNAFASFQNANQDGKMVVIFLCHAMQPSRFVGQMERYQFLLNE